MSNSGLRPDIKDKYSKASAYFDTCEGDPGNKITGMLQAALIC